MPLPLRDLAHEAGPADPDLAGEHRPEPVHPEPHTLMANVDAALMQQVLNIAERQREADIHHHRKLDDLGRCLEVAEWISGHGASLDPSPCPLNRAVPLTMPDEPSKLDAKAQADSFSVVV